MERDPEVTGVPVPRVVAVELAEPLPAEVSPRRLRRSLATVAVLVAIVAAAIVLLPGVDDLRSNLGHADPAWIVLGVVLEVASALAYVVAFRRVFCARMTWPAGLKIGLAELGADAVLPVGGAGGLALGAWALRRGGMPGARIARRTVAFFLLTSAPSVGLLALLGVALAVGFAPGHVSLLLALVPAAAAVAAIAGTLLLGRLTARGSRFAALRATAGGVDDAVVLLRGRDPQLLAGLAGYLAFDILVLWAAFRALGPAPPITVIAIAYLIGQLGNLVPLPGGIGGVEGGLMGALVLSGAGAAAAAAAVLVYRAVQLWIPALLGGVAFVALQRMLNGEADEIAFCDDGQTVEILGTGPVTVARPRP
jgi:uncharacterized membrane protein YbhN (UPF0104 family)